MKLLIVLWFISSLSLWFYYKIILTQYPLTQPSPPWVEASNILLSITWFVLSIAIADRLIPGDVPKED